MLYVSYRSSEELRGLDFPGGGDAAREVAQYGFGWSKPSLRAAGLRR